MNIQRSRYLVSLFAIFCTTLVLFACDRFSGTPDTELASSYYLLASEFDPNLDQVAIEGCGTEYLNRVPVQLGLIEALDEMFAVKDPAQSSLYLSTITPVLVEEDVVDLQGELMSAGTCDIPRIKGQIESTIQAFTPLHLSYTITLNGSESAYRCFGDESGQCS